MADLMDHGAKMPHVLAPAKVYDCGIVQAFGCGPGPAQIRHMAAIKLSCLYSNPRPGGVSSLNKIDACLLPPSVCGNSEGLLAALINPVPPPVSDGKVLLPIVADAWRLLSTLGPKVICWAAVIRPAVPSPHGNLGLVEHCQLLPEVFHGGLTLHVTLHVILNVMNIVACGN